MEWIKQESLKGIGKNSPNRAPEGDLLFILYRFTPGDTLRLGIASYQWINWEGDRWDLHQVGAVRLPFTIIVEYWMPIPATPATEKCEEKENLAKYNPVVMD